MASASSSMQYAGEALTTEWDGWQIFFSWIVASVGSYSAVAVLDHQRWRDKSKVTSTVLILRYPIEWCAVALAWLGMVGMHVVAGGGATPHFVPQTHEKIPVHYVTWILCTSAIVCIALLWAALRVANTDYFSCPDRLEKLFTLVQASNPDATLHDIFSSGHTRRVYALAFFARMQHMVAAALLTAVGVGAQHYMTLRGEVGEFVISMEWGWVLGSVLISFFLACISFWIIFRLLLWKASQAWLKPLCAMLLGAALSGMHYISLLGVTFSYSPGRPLPSEDTFLVKPQIVLGCALVCTVAALLAERAVTLDLRNAYARLYDTNFFANVRSTSGVTRRASTGNGKRVSIVGGQAVASHLASHHETSASCASTSNDLEAARAPM